MKSTIIFVFVLWSSLVIPCQATNIDSLEQLVQDILIDPKIEEEQAIQELLKLSNAYLKADAQKALHYAQIALRLAQERQSAIEEMEATTIVSDAYSKLNKLDSAAYVLRSAIHKYTTKNGNKKHLSAVGNLHQYLAFIYNDKSQLLQAAQQLDTAAQYFDRSSDTFRQISAKYNQANILTKLDNYDMAEKAFYEILEISDNPRVRAAVYTSLGISASKQEKHHESIDLYKLALKLKTHLGEPELCYMNIGIAYRKLSQYEQATYYLKLAESQSIQRKNNRALLLINNNMARTLYQNNQLDAALKYLEKTEKQVKKDNLQELMSIADIRTKIYEKQGKWEDAFVSMTKKNSIEDSIKSIEKHKAITEIQAKYEHEKKEKENLRLKTDKALQESTIKLQRNTLWSTIAGIVGLSILSFFLFKRSKERKQSNNLLTQKNKQLEVKKEKIEVLHKELAHRVKNNLFFMSSLLQLQGQSIKDETARQALREGEARLQAMSILHRKLGMENIKDTVHLGKYLQEICDYLKQSFYDNENRFPEIHVQSDELYIDAQAAMRVGIIINELITNSLKYAFQHQANPTIQTEISAGEFGRYTIHYKDNGTGLSENFNFNTTDSLGMKLIDILT